MAEEASSTPAPAETTTQTDASSTEASESGAPSSQATTRGPDGKFAPKSSGDGPPSQEGHQFSYRDVVSKIGAEELRKHGERYASLDDLIKGNLELRKQVSNREGWVRAPYEGMPDDEAAAWRKATGVPDGPEAYGIGVDSDDPQASERLGGFLKAMHAAGAPRSAVEAAVQFHTAMVQAAEENALQTLEAEKKQGLEELSREWGHDRQRNSELALRTAREFFGDDGIRLIEEAGLGNHPAVLKGLARIGSLTAEDIPAIAHSQADIKTEFEEMKAEEKRRFGTPEWSDEAFRRRRDQVYKKQFR